MAGPYANGSDIKAAILDRAARPDLTDVVDEFLRMAEIDAQRELNLRFCDAVVTGSFDGSTDVLTLPDGSIDVRALWLLEPRQTIDVVGPAQWLAVAAQEQGSNNPTAGMWEGLTIRLTATPASGRGYELHHLTELPSLTDASTNWLLDNGPDVLLYGGLVHLAAHLHDDAAIQRWAGLQAGPLARLKRLEWRAKAGHGPLYARPRGPTP